MSGVPTDSAAKSGSSTISWRWPSRSVTGATLLEEMLAPDPPVWDKADEIKEVEHECDSVTHEIIQRLHRTFVTPLDREDIHALARSLDDVMDAIDAAAAVVRLYQHRRACARTRASWPASSWRRADAGRDRASKALEQRNGVAEPAVEINRLENEADACTRARCAGCSRRSSDPITIIKWKEILDFLEEATDRCEDVANVLEGVVVKHA